MVAEVASACFDPDYLDESHLVEMADQQPLVLVLGVDQHVGIGADAAPHLPERNPGHPLAPDPEVRHLQGEPGRDHLVGEAKLPVELKRPGLDAHRAGGGAGLERPVDDAQGDAAAGEPQGEE